MTGTTGGAPMFPMLRMTFLRVPLAALLFVCVAAITLAQGSPSGLLPENQVTRVSDHVYAIIGFPNIGIVVGDRATLVVDTGMGARNGATVVREGERLSKNPLLYL